MAVLLALGSDVMAQGVSVGIGIGIDEVHRVGQAAAIVPCGTNFVFDQTVACNAVAWVMTGY
jgi:hypothetical protein